MHASALRAEDLELTIPAHLSRLTQVRAFADSVAAAFGFGAEDRFQIRLAASEAVANAVEHGSASPEDLIRLRAVAERGSLTFYVTDTGSYRTALPPMPSTVLPERGRGRAIMDRIMDEVAVRASAEGTVIRFSKRLAA